MAKFNHLSIVLGLSITHLAGIAATYGRRIRQMIQKAAQKRSSKTDYFSLPIARNSDVKAAAIRDFDVRAESIRKEKEKDKTEAGKG